MSLIIQGTFLGVAEVALVDGAAKTQRVAQFAVANVTRDDKKPLPTQDSRSVAVMPFAIFLSEAGDLHRLQPVVVYGEAQLARITAPSALAQLHQAATVRRRRLQSAANVWFARHAKAAVADLNALNRRLMNGALSPIGWLEAQTQLLFPFKEPDEAFLKYRDAQLAQITAAGQAEAAVTTPVYYLTTVSSVYGGGDTAAAEKEVPAPAAQAVPVIRDWEVDVEAEWRRWQALAAVE